MGCQTAWNRSGRPERPLCAQRGSALFLTTTRSQRASPIPGKVLSARGGLSISMINRGRRKASTRMTIVIEIRAPAITPIAVVIYIATTSSREDSIHHRATVCPCGWEYPLHSYAPRCDQSPDLPCGVLWRAPGSPEFATAAELRKRVAEREADLRLLDAAEAASRAREAVPRLALEQLQVDLKNLGYD